MKKIILPILIMIVSVCFSGCNPKITISEEDASKLCELSNAASKNKDYFALNNEIKRIFGNRKFQVHTSKEGIYIDLNLLICYGGWDIYSNGQ